MLTDDDLLDRLRSSFSGSVASVTTDPGLLSRVHHDHHKSVRRQRLLVPAGLAVLGLGSFAAVDAWPSPAAAPADRLGAAPTPSPTPVAGPTVKLFDYTFTLPPGYEVGTVLTVDLAKAEPPQPVHGLSASFTARSGSRSLDVTVYRGPIADAEATVMPPNPDSVHTWTIAGFPAKSSSYAAGGPQCLTKENGRTLIHVSGFAACSQEGSETRVTTAPHEQVWVNAEDVPMTTVRDVLESGLA